MGTSPSDKHKYPVWALGRGKKERGGVMQLDYAATQTHQGKRGSGWQPGGWASSSNSFSVVQKAI